MKSFTFRNASAVISLLIGLLTSANSTCGQNQTNTTTDPPGVTRKLTGTNSIPLAKVPSVILKGLSQEDVFKELGESVLKRVFNPKDTNNAFLKFISDWHLRPKLFQTSGSSNDATFGIEFDYDKALASHVLNGSAKSPVGLALSLHAKGDVAFEAKKNPNNLIEAGGSLHLFQGLGGIDPTYTASREAALNLQQAITNITRIDSAEYRSAVKQFTAHMRPHLFYDVQAHGTYETDQQFANKQWTYGGKFLVAFRDWRSKSEVGWFNVFDYPFAAIRSLINQEEFQPSGRTFPSIVAGIDLVDPSMNDGRLAIDPNKDAYPRLRVEVGFKTPVMRFGSDSLYVSAAYRHYQELGASSLIKTENLDHSDYFVARLDLPYKFNISYSTGKLPLDRKNDQVYAVGWTLNF